MRTTERSTVVSSLHGDQATIPDVGAVARLGPDEATATAPEGWIGADLTHPTRTDVWIAREQLPTVPLPRPPRRLGRGSAPLTPIEGAPRAGEAAPMPRSSTAPPYPLVAGSGPRPGPALALGSGPRAIHLPPLRLESSPERERPIAWGRVFAAVALMSALIGGVIARLAYRPRAAATAEARGAQAAPAWSGVAVLPFESRASAPALRDAPRALAKVIADELAAQTMLDLATPGAGERPPAAAAVVRGSLADDAAGGVRLRVELVRGGGKPVTVLDRRAAPGELADALRAGVPAFAGLLVEPRELPRHLALGRRALLEDRPAAALRHLRTILLHDPGHRDARYEHAIAARWSGDAAAALAALRDALAAPLAPLQREVLAAHVQLADERSPEALAAFGALAARHPEDVHVLLGLFEAQLHAGRGAEAVATYGRLRRLEPRVQLGARRVLAYAAAHPDAPDLAWAREAIARDHAAAEARDPHDPDLALARLRGALVAGRFGEVEGAVSALASRRPAAHAAYRLALAHARGDRAALAAGPSPDELAAIERADAGELVELAALADELGRADLRERVVRALDRQPAAAQRALSSQLARALLGELAASPYPEVDAVALAIGAERAGDWRAAAAAWRAAAKLSLDGRAAAVEQLGLARSLYRDGDLEGAAAVCRDILEPRSLQLHWGAAAGDCFVWAIEAALERRVRGRPDRGAAIELAEQLAALRAPGGPLDPIVRRARALLVQ